MKRWEEGQRCVWREMQSFGGLKNLQMESLGKNMFVRVCVGSECREGEEARVVSSVSDAH